MAFANDPTDPANMTSEQRTSEIAAILASGILRLRQRAALPAGANVAQSGEIGLDDSAETRLYEQRG